MGSPQLTISLELIALMKWILQKQPSELRSLVNTAIRDGFSDELLSVAQNPDAISNDELYRVVNSFLGVLEKSMYDKIMQDDFAEQMVQPSIPADTPVTQDSLYHTLSAKTQAQLHSFSDDNLVQTSLQKAATQLHLPAQDTESAAKRALFASLLDEWVPNTEEDELN